MIDYTRNSSRADRTGFDAGLREYMLKIYNIMGLGLLITGLMAYATLNFMPLTMMMYQVTPNGAIAGFSTFGTIMNFVPLGIALYFFWGNATMSVQKSQILFWVYAATMGLALSNLGLMYTGQSIARTFFITASLFGGMSIYGYSTKKDLSSMGSFMVMGLMGIILASIVNFFLQSQALYYAISYIGVIVFTGLIAYDTQKLKSLYYQSGGGAEGQRVAIIGAFTLYLDFINLFLYMLRLFGDRRN